MEILNYSKYMEGEVEFDTSNNELLAQKYWNEGRNLYIDEYNRVFDDMGVWIANIK